MGEYFYNIDFAVANMLFSLETNLSSSLEKRKSYFRCKTPEGGGGRGRQGYRD